MKQIEQITKPEPGLGYCNVDLLDVTRTVQAIAKKANKPGKVGAVQKEYKVYGLREYTCYIWAESENDALKKAELVPLNKWDPNEIEGEEINPKEAGEVG